MNLIESLWLIYDPSGPVCIQVGAKWIKMWCDVAAHSGIAIPKPRSAYAGTSFNNHKIQPHQAEVISDREARNPTSNNDELKFKFQNWRNDKI